MKGHGEHELPRTGATTDSPKDSPKDRLCPSCLSLVPHLSLSPSSQQMSLRPLSSTEDPLSTVPPDLIITKPEISLGFICLKFPLLCLTVSWVLHSLDSSPSLMTPPFTISFCDHFFCRIFLFFLPSDKWVPYRKSEDRGLSYKAGERLQQSIQLSRGYRS